MQLYVGIILLIISFTIVLLVTGKKYELDLDWRIYNAIKTSLDIEPTVVEKPSTIKTIFIYGLYYSCYLCSFTAGILFALSIGW
jgi:hypothetical protein